MGNGDTVLRMNTHFENMKSGAISQDVFTASQSQLSVASIEPAPPVFKSFEMYVLLYSGRATECQERPA